MFSPEDTARSPRLFFALLPDAAARDALDELARELARETGGKAVPAANVHLTLAFLGSLPRDRLARVEAIGGATAQRAAAFDVALDRVGYFRAARVAWAGQAPTHPALQRLFDRLRTELASAGLPAEQRPFHPHATLARHCRRPPADMPWPGTRWRAEALTLMAPEALPGGARYRTLASWAFAADADAGHTR